LSNPENLFYHLDQIALTSLRVFQDTQVSHHDLLSNSKTFYSNRPMSDNPQLMTPHFAGYALRRIECHNSSLLPEIETRVSLFVNIPAMSDFYDDHDEFLIKNFIPDPVVSLSDAIPFPTGQLFAPYRLGLIGETLNLLQDPRLVLLLNRLQILLARVPNLDFIVCHRDRDKRSIF
jgi:hypothetical protein